MCHCDPSFGLSSLVACWCNKEGMSTASALISVMTKLPCCGCRASDDIEGELGRQIDSCMHSALSQCWGGPSIQSVNPKPVVSQAQPKVYQSSHLQSGIQFHQEMMTKFGPDRQVRSGNTDITVVGI
jgi:hypothetical protein